MYYQNELSDTTEISALNRSHSFMHIKNLQKNSSYTFKIYSANENGISKDFGSILIDSGEKSKYTCFNMYSFINFQSR